MNSYESITKYDYISVNLYESIFKYDEFCLNSTLLDSTFKPAYILHPLILNHLIKRIHCTCNWTPHLFTVHIPTFEHLMMCLKHCDGMANSVDPDQTAPIEAV